MVWAYACIVGLTAILLIVNIRSAMREYQLHRYVLRTSCQLATLLFVGLMLTTVSYLMINRSMDAALALQEESINREVRHSLKI